MILSFSKLLRKKVQQWCRDVPSLILPFFVFVFVMWSRRGKKTKKKTKHILTESTRHTCSFMISNRGLSQIQLSDIQLYGQTL